MRFGPTAWDEILSERAQRINQAKEAQRKAKARARQQQQEIMDILKWGWDYISWYRYWHIIISFRCESICRW